MSLQDTRSVSSHSSRGTRLHLPQLRETKKDRRPEPPHVRMLDGRSVSALLFDSMCENSRAALEGIARGCAGTIESIVPHREWKAVRKWMDLQRNRLKRTDEGPVVPDDTFVAILIVHTASYRRVSPKLLYAGIVREQTLSILFRS